MAIGGTRRAGKPKGRRSAAHPRDRALSARIRRLESILDSSGLGTWEWNVPTGHLLCNERLAEMLGYSLAQLRPLDVHTWQALMHPDELAEHSQRLDQHFAGVLARYDRECRMRHADGHWVWVHLLGRVVSQTVDGRPLMMLGTQLDITERKQAEAAAKQTDEALRQTEAFLATIYQNSDVGIFVVEVSEAGSFTYSGINTTHEQLMGVKNEDVVGKSPQHLLPHLGPQTVAYIEALYLKCVRERVAQESEFFIERGAAQGWWLSRLTPVLAGDGGRVIRLIGSSTPINSLKRAEAALRESEERLRLAVQASNVGLWDWELSTDRVRYSREWKAQLGYEEHELSDDFSEWRERMHPEDVDAVVAKVQRYLEAPKGPHEVEFRMRHKDGSWRWIYVRAEVLCDPSGQPTRFLGCHLDVTERRLLEEQLRHAQRMEAIGQLAGGVAHDFNNLLTVIQGNTEMLREGVEDPGEREETLSELSRATDRAILLTRQLLTFSRRQRIEARTVDLNAVVQNMGRMLERLIGKDVRLQLQLAPVALGIHADTGLLEQLLVNLAVNARDAMPGGGQLLIETRAVELPQGAPLRPEARPGSYAGLRLTDSGSGIAPEHLPHIFEPFFTTKDVGKGTGLGLATVFGIVKQHDGWLEVSSELTRGSRFEIFLPAVSGVPGSVPVGAPESARDAAPPELLPASAASPVLTRAGSAVILLVEDEEPVRRLVQRILAQAGYGVLCVTSGREALQVLERDGHGVELVLTDLIMPGGTSGQDLGRRVRERWPKLRVLYMSGYTGDSGAPDVPDQLRLHPGARTLAKPFTPAALLASVRACLETDSLH